MMKLWHTFILTALAISFLSAQSDSYYTVQAGTFIDAQAGDFEALRSVGFVYAKDLGDNLIEVYVGGYEERAAAEAKAEEVQRSGYPNAFVKEVAVSDGQPTTVVQMATRQTNKDIEWETLMQAGPLYGILKGNLIKIVTGPYANRREAKAALPDIQQMGYSDAFVKTISSAYLLPLGEFETGVKEPLIPLDLDASRPSDPRGTTTAKGQPDSYAQTGERLPPSKQLPRNKRQPGMYDAPPEAYEVLAARSPEAPTPPDIPVDYDYYDGSVQPNTAGADAAPGLPAIDGSVKRGSVLRLQEILKAAEAYTGSLDGYYGPNTKKGYEKYVAQSRVLKNYALLARNRPLPGGQSGSSDLQQAINELDDNFAPERLDPYRNDPLAKAYQAYLLFSQYGPGEEVNQLMNTAINGAFNGQPMEGLPFDPKSTYAYQDMSQLILHLHYIHAAPGTEEAAPCWLMYRHPQEVSSAYNSMASLVGKELNLQGCGQFEAWPEVRMLVTIAADLSGKTSFNEKRLAQAATERSRLYMAPKPLNSNEAKAVENWNKNLLKGLETWSAQDPLHEKLATAFKSMYFQAQVRLEDYFMDKGYDRKKSTALALATLHTLVAYHMQRFV